MFRPFALGPLHIRGHYERADQPQLYACRPDGLPDEFRPHRPSCSAIWPIFRPLPAGNLADTISVSLEGGMDIPSSTL